jgi:hypothetical protein
MRHLAAFLTRVGVFVVLGSVQRAIVLSNPVLHGLDTRILISSLQIFLVGSMLALYVACHWMFAIMHINAPYSNVHLACDDSPSMHGEVASQVSQGLVAQQVVIFADRDALSRHVMRVYLVGFLLYATVFCFNYTATAVIFHMSTGVLLGFLTRSVQTAHPSTLTVMFSFLVSSIVVLTYIDLATRGWSITDPKDIVTGVVMPVVVGFAWVSGLCFGDNNRFCVEMSREAFPVCCMCVMPVIWAAPFAQWTRVFDEFDASTFMLVLVVEPIAKFLSIYVLMISLQTQNVLDISLVICSVAQGELLLDQLSIDSAGGRLTTARLVLVVIVLTTRTLQYCYIDLNNLCERSMSPLNSPSGSCAGAHKMHYNPDLNTDSDLHFSKDLNADSDLTSLENQQQTHYPTRP